jgi:ABC-type dipeptide/oligopeptide/nickel transport system permease subunit
MRRFRRNRLALLGCVIVGFWAIIFFGADIIAPFDPKWQGTDAVNSDVNLPAGAIAHKAPYTGRVHLLGTDSLGRDILSRIMYGSRVSMSVGFVAQGIILLVGLPLGLMAGYFGGIFDQIVMRFGEIIGSFPDLLFLIMLSSIFQQRSIWIVFLVLGATGWVTMARMVRGQVLQIKQLDYVTGARSIGARSGRLMFNHILPNIIGPVIVLVTLGLPGAIISEATLTFLGVGVDPTFVTWGTMMFDARASMQYTPLTVLYIALALSSLVLGMTFIGDGVRDAFDPKTKAK